MLKSLFIQNYAIIEKLDIQLNPGLTVITGETGAGKSILLGALGLIMGNRADTSVLFDQKEKCIVEASYKIGAYDLEFLFEEEGLDYDDICIIRREISTSGKSRAFINDTPVTLDILRKLNRFLVDLHQQFDTLEIHAQEFQLSLLDALADNASLLNSYRKEFTERKILSSHFKELIQKNIEAVKELDYVRFQLSEIESMNLREGEVEELEEEFNRLSGSEEIREAGENLIHVIDESEYSIINMLLEVMRKIDSISGYEKTALEIYERLLSVKEELSDLSSTASRMLEAAESDPSRLQIVELRLNDINRLISKHRVENERELIRLKLHYEKQLETFDNMEAEIAETEKQLKKKEEKLDELSELLHTRRKSVIPKLEENVKNTLYQLSMENALLKVKCQYLDDWKQSGKDDITFLFTANKGVPSLPLHKVASGGELSRLNLAIKSLVADAVTLPTLIFDEIDTGVSGHVALKMGEILKQLAQKHQTVVITHSPQVASRANHHFYIFKNDINNRTVTRLRLLKEEERIHEIAKMLSGDPPSQEAVENAKHLLTR